ncbi:MAG: DUF4314 domain-containing protein [Lawsonibacter sp.]|nr:DUF4314 domain-containing protein [Lawsonibacter sp.]
MLRSQIPNRETIDRLRKEYPAGCRIQLISMDDPYTNLHPGLEGTVSLIDDIGTIFVNWDNGSYLGVVYGIDRIKKV